MSSNCHRKLISTLLINFGDGNKFVQKGKPFINGVLGLFKIYFLTPFQKFGHFGRNYGFNRFSQRSRVLNLRTHIRNIAILIAK